MIHRTIEFSLRQQVLVLMGATALLVAGLWAAWHLPIDAVPDITNVQVQINTEVPALAPEESERLVTFPIETEMSGLPGMEEMRSLTKFGLSQVTLGFKDGTDVYRARQLVSERLQNLAETLPAGVVPRLAPISTGLGEIFYYTVDYAPDATNKPISRPEQLMQLREIQDYVIKPMLRNTPGIAEVNTAGGFERQWVVQPDPGKLFEAGLTFSDLAEVVGRNVQNAGGGIVNRGDEQLVIRGVSRVESLEQIANLPVKFGAAVTPLRVRDVAEVVVGTNVRTGAASENGEETVLGTAMMLVGENSRVVARRVGERLRQIQERLPSGVVITPQYDRAELVDRTIRTVKTNLFEGALLVVAVLLGLLGNWRAALIVAAAIPLSFLFAITGMLQGRISGNLMSLGAIDFGLIIDGAVVMVENIVRQLGQRQHHLGRPLHTEERLHTVLSASKQVASPMFFGVVIITIVYVPILALTGIEGKMFHPMAVTVMLALVGALVLALTLMPVLCSYLLRGSIREGDNVVVRLVKRAYVPSLELALRLRWLVVAGAVGLFAFSLWVFPRLGAEFVPKLDEGSFTVMVYRSNSLSLAASTQMELETEKLLLRQVPEVTRVFSRIGTSEVATDPMPASQNDLYIFYKPRREWRQTNGAPLTKEALAAAIDAVVQEHLPGQAFMFAQPIEMRFNELLEGVRADISVKIFGNNYDVLDKLAEQTKALLEQVPGAGDVEFEVQGRSPVLLIQVDRDALLKYNLPADEVNRVISTALGGEVVGQMLEGNRRHDIVVRLPERMREDLEAIRSLPVRVGDYGFVTLGQVAAFNYVSSVDTILRDAGNRRAAIMVNLRGRDVESFVREAEARVKQEVRLPEGYTLEFGGQFENLVEAKARLALVVPAALVMIFLLVFMAFGSLRQALLVYSGIPLALTGGVLALWARGMPFSITAAVGFIALSGVAVLNGLVMITYFNQLREQGRSLREAVREGAVTRLRPVLMTALVASLGFVPMALATGAGAEVQRPLATVVIGGILTSTFLTLVLLPVLYAWFEREPEAEPVTATLRTAASEA
jgi:cobalt-zinc-cadmium resistance protein CzcA